VTESAIENEMSMTGRSDFQMDKIAFVVCVSVHEAIGITMRNEVHYFNYKTKTTKPLEVVGIDYSFPEGMS